MRKKVHEVQLLGTARIYVISNSYVGSPFVLLGHKLSSSRSALTSTA